MKQTLELKLGQHLTITPQLQQAIRLLQLSSIELQQEIQEALESNPLLEEQEEEFSGEKADADNETLDGSDPDRPADEDTLEPTDLKMESVTGEDDAGQDELEWAESFELPMTGSTRNNQDGSFPDIDARNSPEQTLADHLEWQVQMTPFSNRDKEIAYTLIDSINEDGYLTSTLKDIKEILNRDADGQPIDADEIEAVLHQLQNFDPIGIGARDLSECLQLQLKALDPMTPALEQARHLATPENLALLGKHDLNKLRRRLKLTPDELQQAIVLIQELNPRPGAEISATQAAYIIPDIIVKKFKGVWRAELNGEVAPRLHINHQYEQLIQRGDNSSENKYLQDQLQQARWLIKSLSSRNETMLKVAKTIVDRQRAFFDHGPEAMKPLVLHDIANAVEMHESTISRVTTNKYMLTPRGIFELKYFFSSHVGTIDGGTCSATAIRSLIKKLVASESPSRPISDSQIAQALEEQGINVARRTIAKYRESMNIPPSSKRKSLV